MSVLYTGGIALLINHGERYGLGEFVHYKETNRGIMKKAVLDYYSKPFTSKDIQQKKTHAEMIANFQIIIILNQLIENALPLKNQVLSFITLPFSHFIVLDGNFSKRE